jgi:hypothetical protein
VGDELDQLGAAGLQRPRGRIVRRDRTRNQDEIGREVLCAGEIDHREIFQRGNPGRRLVHTDQQVAGLERDDEFARHGRERDDAMGTGGLAPQGLDRRRRAARLLGRSAAGLLGRSAAERRGARRKDERHEVSSAERGHVRSLSVVNQAPEESW